MSVHLGLLVGYKACLNVMHQLWQVLTLAAERSTMRHYPHACFPADLIPRFRAGAFVGQICLSKSMAPPSTGLKAALLVCSQEEGPDQSPKEADPYQEDSFYQEAAAGCCCCSTPTSWRSLRRCCNNRCWCHSWPSLGSSFLWLPYGLDYIRLGHS